jgi:hypothetical protein
MSYDIAMKIAGATILAFQEFGSYQGSWWAHVAFNGQRGWINGSYGSCSGCDAYEKEMGYDSHDHDEKIVSSIDVDDWLLDCDKCERYREKMAAFGRSYLVSLMTDTEAEAQAAKNCEGWDDEESRKALAFVKEHRG